MKDLAKRYAKLYCGVVYDALCFDIKYDKPYVVHRDIKPAWKAPFQGVLFGHAFTCKGKAVHSKEEIDDTVRIKMFKEFTDGCIQVIDTDKHDAVAHFGDISGKIARKFGAKGVVVDGHTRDIRILEEDRFPIFCRNVQPIDAFERWQIVEYQVPIVLSGADGDVAVSPNDYIFADADGVIVIPADLGEAVCAHAEERLAKENTVRRRLKSCKDIQKLYDEIGRW